MAPRRASLLLSLRGIYRYSALIGALFVWAGALASGCSVVAPQAERDSGTTDDPSHEAGAESRALHDPLSMPAEPTLSMKDFHSASYCSGCHPTHFAEWRTSRHAFAMRDPVFRALVRMQQEEFGGRRDQFCTQCHSAIGTRGGDIGPLFSFDDLKPITLEGVTCEACHKVVAIERLSNSGHVLDGQAAIRGPIADPVENSFHASEFSTMHDSAGFCAGCHDVSTEDGLSLERPFAEWATSPAAREGRNCQSCHMPVYGGKAASLPGVPWRDNLHVHRFVGVDIPLDDDFIATPELRERIRAEVVALLRSAGAIELEAPACVPAGERVELLVTVRNLIDAHNFPTGSTFNREVWLEVTATDARGILLYRTGGLDENGDLRADIEGSPQPGRSDLMTFHSRFRDAEGNPTVFPWRAAQHDSNSLPPLAERTLAASFETQPDTPGPIMIAARLRFRAYPPSVLRALDLVELSEKLEIIDIDEKVIWVDLE